MIYISLRPHQHELCLHQAWEEGNWCHHQFILHASGQWLLHQQTHVWGLCYYLQQKVKQNKKTDSKRPVKYLQQDWRKRRENDEIIMLLVSGPWVRRSWSWSLHSGNAEIPVLKQSAQPVTQPTDGMNFRIPCLSLWCGIIFSITHGQQQQQKNQNKQNKK